MRSTSPTSCLGCTVPPAQPDEDLQAFLKALASETRQQLMRHFTGGVALPVK